MENTALQNKMGIAPVKKLLLSMGIPMILSMMLQAVYNIVDSAFVSNMKSDGEAALNALTLAFPVQMLMIAVGIGTGVGANALLSKSLGEGNLEKASKVSGNTVFLSLIIYAAFLVFGLCGLGFYIRSQTENQNIAKMAHDYLFICCTMSFGIVFFSVYEKILQSTGRSHLSTIAQIAGALTNIVLDPIFIYGWLGFPTLGVKGAAYATVTGQIVSMILAVTFHLKFDKEISNKIRYLKPSGKIIKGIYTIGLPAIISQALMSVMTYGLNIILVSVSEAAVTAYGLYYKIQQFILFAAFGLRDAITPIVSFNRGMANRPRVLSGIKYGLIYTEIIMAVGLLALEIFAAPLASVFGLSGTTQSLCINAERIISISFIFAGINIALQGVFQALDGGIESLVISVLRQLVFIIPAAWALALCVTRYMPDDIWLVWTAFPAAEGLSAVIACIYMKRIKKKKIETLSA